MHLISHLGVPENLPETGYLCTYTCKGKNLNIAKTNWVFERVYRHKPSVQDNVWPSKDEVKHRIRFRPCGMRDRMTATSLYMYMYMTREMTPGKPWACRNRWISSWSFQNVLVRFVWFLKYDSRILVCTDSSSKVALCGHTKYKNTGIYLGPRKIMAHNPTLPMQLQCPTPHSQAARGLW